MLKLKQSTPTNCLRTCIACLLHKPIDVIPLEFDLLYWDFQLANKQLAKTLKHQLLEINVENGGVLHPLPVMTRCIISYRTENDTLHAVIAETDGINGFKVIHDPANYGDKITSPVYVAFLLQVGD